MLILTRRKDESIIIDGNIEIKILEMEDGKVKIGIDAPRDIDIIRKELYKKMQDENLAALNNTSKLDDVKRLFNKKTT
ncbi:carbon storage regulator CsrA [Tissierella praeacuta]|uniref:Translational regulator CsrA n=1 Tax=Tissierella praeacuta DSM 18095 TaxID=1123404 RepID=A0A1M4X208_9FIRM|nr:carbon storage regulator CsrA [Tissierella praeacuta]MBU5255689.1 carbon storage regulator CsrA [Tissierella praeacuta]TCU79028.1 carbon storage regulator CsrA [Tissierella praeacuta]SHE87373.1 carbon storage regulator, CsrA [Tissierella praeacuta DSM 18095]SUO99633.1 Carbon storage regulator homolog [Tissierella praeacuta]